MVYTFRTPLYIRCNFLSEQTLILWREPYPRCVPFYAFEDGLFCPITFDLRGLI